MFCLLDTIPDGLKYITLYRFVSHIGVNPVLTALEINWCAEMGWEQTAVRDGILSCNLFCGNFMAEKRFQYKRQS